MKKYLTIAGGLIALTIAAVALAQIGIDKEIISIYEGKDIIFKTYPTGESAGTEAARIKEDGALEIDVIDEGPGADGVTIDGVKLKDGGVEATGLIDSTNGVSVTNTNPTLRLMETDSSDSNWQWRVTSGAARLQKIEDGPGFAILLNAMEIAGSTGLVGFPNNIDVTGTMTADGYADGAGTGPAPMPNNISIGGTNVTSTAAELNTLNGASATLTAAKLNQLDDNVFDAEVIGTANLQSEGTAPLVRWDETDSTGGTGDAKINYYVQQNSDNFEVKVDDLGASATTALKVNKTAGVTVVQGGNLGGNVPHQCLHRNNGASSDQATASCAAGEFAMGGGCNHSSGTAVIEQSFPQSTTTWKCRYDITGTVTAYVICCDY